MDSSAIPQGDACPMLLQNDLPVAMMHRKHFWVFEFFHGIEKNLLDTSEKSAG